MCVYNLHIDDRLVEKTCAVGLYIGYAYTHTATHTRSNTHAYTHNGKIGQTLTLCIGRERERDENGE